MKIFAERNRKLKFWRGNPPFFLYSLKMCAIIGTNNKGIKRMKTDDFGDRMKLYEGIEANRMLIPTLPICIRLDGKCFHKYTKGLQKPYDQHMNNIMIQVTKDLVKECNAVIGYTQSDEISLILYSDNIKSQTYFNGRISKITSVLAALASVKFNIYAKEAFGDSWDKIGLFDCRVWNVPSKVEATNTLLWREQDATKNSISSAAHCFYSNKQLLGKNSKEKQEMLFQVGVNWNNYPTHFKRGTYVRRVSFVKVVEDNVTVRHIIKEIDMPPLGTIKNRVDAIFEN